MSEPLFHVLIPARLQSTRLPGKLLLDLQGKTVLQRVYEQAQKAAPVSITIATDSDEIMQHASAYAALVKTSASHQSGTDRIAEAILSMSLAPDAIIVNVQGDEPLIDPRLISQVAALLSNTDANMATLCWPITNPDDFHNPNVVKVVRNALDEALYFSRAPIPFKRDEGGESFVAYRHIGLYAYRAKFLLEFVAAKSCELERIEALEQLRVLWMGHKIVVATACVAAGQDINTQEDLQAARALLEIPPIL